MINAKYIRRVEPACFKPALVVLITAAVLVSSLSFAFAGEPPDSSSKTLPEIEVEAEKIETEIDPKYVSATSIPKSSFETYEFATPDYLISIAPGVSALDYGGAAGVKTLSIRGNSSKLTAVALNGFVLNSSQSGSFDFSTWPARFLSGATIYRSGASAFFGGGAGAGAVDFTPAVIPYGFSGTLETAVGSFGKIRTSGDISNSSDKNKIRIGVERTISDGNFKFDAGDYGTGESLRRLNSKFENLSFYAGGQTKFDRTKISGAAMFGDFRRGAPGPVLRGGYQNESANLDESRALALVSSKTDISKTETLEFGSSFNFKDAVFRDPEAFGGLDGGLTNTFFLRENFLKARYEKRFSFGELSTETSADYSRLTGNSLEPEAAGAVDRTTLSLGAIWTSSVIDDESLEISYLAAARLDEVSGVGSEISPAVSVSLDPKKNPISGSIYYSRNFRAPSFDESYYLNYGNKELKPERSRTINLSLGYNLFKINRIEAALFYISTEDQIQSVPISAVSWTAENVGKVVSKGLEISARGAIAKNLDYYFAYSLQSVRNETKDSPFEGLQVPFAPAETFSALLNYEIGKIRLSSRADYSSYRYALPDNSPNSILKSYLRIDAVGSYEIKLDKISVKVYLSGSNLLNAEYESFMNYPAPGISAEGGLSVSFARD